MLYVDQATGYLWKLLALITGVIVVMLDIVFEWSARPTATVNCFQNCQIARSA